MLGPAISTVADLVRAILAGSPVLARRLWGPAAKNRAAAAELRQKAATAQAAERAAQLAKLTGDARLAAEQAHAAQDKTERKERRSRAADVAGGVLLVALLGGPLAWSAVAPWLPVAFWTGLVLWSAAAMMHAPARAAEPAATALAEDEEPLEEPEPADLRQLVVQQLLGWMEERPAIHFAEVYARYRELPEHGHLTDAQIRTALVDHYRIPWRRAVADPRKAQGRARSGVHRDDLQALPPLESLAPVADGATPDLTSTVAA